MNALRSLRNLTLLFFILFSLSTCKDDSIPEFEQGNNQQIFESWRLDEIIRKGCDDANNNFRRPCVECPLLVMNTDNSYYIEGEDQTLLQQGTFRVVDDTEIIFDPGIFTTMGVSNARYSLFKGAIKFDYRDGDTACAVTEAYLVNGNNIAGD